jgi:hypothetical protein
MSSDDLENLNCDCGYSGLVLEWLAKRDGALVPLGEFTMGELKAFASDPLGELYCPRCGLPNIEEVDDELEPD